MCEVIQENICVPPSTKLSLSCLRCNPLSHPRDRTWLKVYFYCKKHMKTRRRRLRKRLLLLSRHDSLLTRRRCNEQKGRMRIKGMPLFQINRNWGKEMGRTRRKIYWKETGKWMVGCVKQENILEAVSVALVMHCYSSGSCSSPSLLPSFSVSLLV